MTFDEWWEKNTRPFLHNEGIAKMTARAGWDAAIANNTPAAPVSDADIEAIEAECWDGRGLGASFDRMKFARAVLALQAARYESDLAQQAIDAARKTAA